jgi:hypothetical protein
LPAAGRWRQRQARERPFSPQEGQRAAYLGRRADAARAGASEVNHGLQRFGNIQRVVERKLLRLDAATTLQGLASPPKNRLEVMMVSFRRRRVVGALSALHSATRDVEGHCEASAKARWVVRMGM